MDFSHWNMARDFSLNEVACLASGIEPIENSTDPRVLAITNLLFKAYTSCRDSCCRVLEQNALDRLAGRDQMYPPYMADAFHVPGGLPSFDLRKSFADALQQPDCKHLISTTDDPMRFSRRDLEEFFLACAFQPAVPFYNQMPKSCTKTETDAATASVKNAKSMSHGKNEAAGLSTRERNTHLCMMAVLCNEARLDYRKPAKTAALISDMASRMGIPLGESTIEGYLKKIPDALESRMT